MRNVYLDNSPRIDALHKWLQACSTNIDYEQIPVESALHRVTFEAVYAHNSNPNFQASAMDGIAVKAYKTYDASEANPVELVKDVDFIPVDTGDPIPDEFDAVIMIERVNTLENGNVIIHQSVGPGQHVRAIGEDIVTKELILTANHQIRPIDQAAMLAAGVLDVPVHVKPKVAIIPTGDEIVKPKRDPERGELIEFNSTIFKGYLEEWGAEVTVFDIVRDELHAIEEALAKAASSHHFVIINAGSSAGSEDYTVHAIRNRGEVVLHGIATRPGKPTILGKIAETPVLGLPGYPVSAWLALDWFAKPLVYRLRKLIPPQRPKLHGILSKRVNSVFGSEEFVRVKIGYVNDKLIVTPIGSGAGVVMSLVLADGIMTIPPEREHFDSGQEVEVELLCQPEIIKNTMVGIGSHDLSLDILVDELKLRYPEKRISSAHVGSMAGIMAIDRGECHFAGIHLLDPETGEYNHSYVKKFVKNTPVSIVHFVHREQGFIVAKGNPKNIQGISDLMRQDIVFVNRQKGAGTRMLFDYLLQQAGIVPSQIAGYTREMFTHSSVAASVAYGAADCAMGIRSAAEAMGCDFVPLCEEKYEFVVSDAFLASEQGEMLLALIRDPRIKSRIEALGGYSCRDTGEIKRP
ncbi:molybdopterin biosynthesis protein [Desulfuribacillus stibiiarsenatis]|uniref:Molybdopterin molybdenumtransferase n=1 Tax=Desulfuribacillus stibiiarsenatis TaxID=1390249 RepID=A0A1E5L5D3_9FIRM|nr:molybdopterin biosynthesis protein [Desulfuribacillus stibiiarsenatis]OEH85213.1 molybdopterin biosynthesis protein [Desulfuribacillus stibiiarsenatis]